MLNTVMTNIPFNGDVNENETVLKFAFNMFSLCKITYIININDLLEKEKIEPYMQNITFTCMKILVDEKCDEVSEPFKREVGKFVKNCIMTSGEENLSILRDLESKMSVQEKEELSKYVC